MISVQAGQPSPQVPQQEATDFSVNDLNIEQQQRLKGLREHMVNEAGVVFNTLMTKTSIAYQNPLMKMQIAMLLVNMLNNAISTAMEKVMQLFKPKEMQAADFFLDNKNFKNADSSGDGILSRSEIQTLADGGHKHAKVLLQEMDKASRTSIKKDELKDMAKNEMEIKDLWIAEHRGYERNEDGSVHVTRGKWKDHTMLYSGTDRIGRPMWEVIDEQKEKVGVWTQKSKLNNDEVKREEKGRVASPLQIDVNGDGFQTQGKGFSFDIDADRVKDTTSWAAKDDIVLAKDVDGNGKIDGGQELFGNNTLTAGKKSGFANGYQALRATLNEVDKNILNDGKVTIDEMEKAGLSALDSKCNMIKTEDLRKTLGNGFEMTLDYTKSNYVDIHGNEHREHGLDGKSRDVWYTFDKG